MTWLDCYCGWSAGWVDWRFCGVGGAAGSIGDLLVVGGAVACWADGAGCSVAGVQGGDLGILR